MARHIAIIFFCILLAACDQAEERQPPAEDAPTAAEIAELEAPPEVEPGEVAPQPILSETVEYGSIEGRYLEGYLSYPEAAHGGLPGIVVFHEREGLDEDIRALVDRLAAQGYVVLAVDLYEGNVAAGAAEARALMQATLDDEARINEHIRQAYKFMDEQIGALSIAALGRGMGGSMAMKMALRYPQRLDAVAIYYGHVVEVGAEQLATLRMPVLGLFAADDPGIPVESVERFRSKLLELGKDATVVILEAAGHGFASPSAAGYDAEAADEAWGWTVKFLDRSLNAAVNRNLLEEDEIEPPQEPAAGEATGDSAQ